MYQNTRFTSFEWYSDQENQIVQASIEGKICAICGKEFSEEETVVRDLFIYIGRPTPRYSHTVSPCCLSHQDKIEPLFVLPNGRVIEASILPEPCACQNCHRPVINLYRTFTRIHTFCCSRCERQWWNRRNRKATQVQCKQCGQEFNQKRSDQKYCKPACRQKAYYQRPTV